jgi:thymidylate synthase
MGYKFAIAEAIHIISGSNRVDNLSPYSKMIEKFSDDRVHFFGAYGPKIIDQIEYIGRCFSSDVYSRQAVINIWREKPPVSKDIPCTLSLQFLIRQGYTGYKLDTIDTMRSSDVWLGVPYDWFSLSMVSAYIALYLRNLVPDLKHLKLGTFYLNAGSQHIYTDNKFYDIEKVKELCSKPAGNCDFDYEPLNLDDFKDEKALVRHLQLLLNGDYGNLTADFLTELEQFYADK